MKGRVFIHVQHLLGTGHTRRAAAVAAALADAGLEVVMASGGPPVAALVIGRAHLIQLPALRARDSSFKELIDEHGRPVDEVWRAARRDQVLAHVRAFRPDVLITELFPFGRRLIEFELVPLIETARALHPRPLVLSSLRDILVAPRDAAKAAEAVRRTKAWYDAVLVHGDPALLDLPASYPAADAVADKTFYTGYIAAHPGPEAPVGDGVDEIIVSAGGGVVGAALFDAAVAARRSGVAAGRRWRFLVGGDLPATARERLAASANEALIVEPARPDFVSLLRRCHVSVSQAGYNTAMDIVEAKVRAVLVPFATEGETEQTQRAAAFAACGWAEVVREAELGGGRLGQAITAAATRPFVERRLNCDGARETVRIVTQLLEQRRTSR